MKLQFARYLGVSDKNLAKYGRIQAMVSGLLSVLSVVATFFLADLIQNSATQRVSINTAREFTLNNRIQDARIQEQHLGLVRAHEEMDLAFLRLVRISVFFAGGGAAIALFQLSALYWRGQGLARFSLNICSKAEQGVPAKSDRSGG